MRVLHVITGLGVGGAERTLFNLLRGGLSERSDTAVVSLLDKGKLGEPIRKLGVPVYLLGMRRRWPGPRVVRRLRSIMRETSPDLIQGWMYHGNLAASGASKLSPGRPAVVWNVRHSLCRLEAEKPLTRQIIRANRLLSRGVQGIIYNSRLSCGQHSHFGFYDRRARVIPNGFDLERLQAVREIGQEVRAELGLASDVLVVGHVARFHPMKDQAGFLRAAVQVARVLPHVRFLVMGREVSIENPALTGIIPSELLERFVFIGERHDTERFMQAMNILVSSSAWGEAFPNVLGEAMACEVPCVATDVGDSADIVGDTGFIVPPSDRGALTEGLLAMLGKDTAERERLGREARDRVARYYSLPRTVERYAGLYEDLFHG